MATHKAHSKAKMPMHKMPGGRMMSDAQMKTMMAGKGKKASGKHK